MAIAAGKTGLSSAAAAARLASDGPNSLPEPETRSLLGIVLTVLREPMLLLLVIGGVVYLALGELQDALILVVFAFFSIIVTIVQEARTERTLRSLRDLSSPRARVMRDGTVQRIASADLVVGDIVLLTEGDRVPADIAIIEQSALQVDESLLTGESVSVGKRALADGDDIHVRPGGDDLPVAYSGTLVVRGDGVGEVVATGVRSEIGRIGQSLAQLTTSTPRLQGETRRLTALLGIAGGIVSVVAVVLYGLARQDWLNAILAGIAIGMSMLPEEFPVVLTVFMAMGAWRIARARVLTRRASAIEALGSASVLCTDKTGTLTQNRMVISAFVMADGQPVALDGTTALPGAALAIAEIGRLASAEQPFDPMDKAFHASAPAPGDGVTLAQSYGLRPDLLAVAQAWRIADAPLAHVAAKGAPEAIAALCHVDAALSQKLRAEVDRMAAEGLRVLGVAEARHTGESWPDSPRGFDFTFVGLVGLSDPLRANVPQAIAECQSAGVRVVMITGDHPRTAEAIARAAGLDTGSVVIGPDLARMSPQQLTDAVRTTSVFARILPEQKLQIVEAFKRNGEIVAMTGDGVNDAPSLKAADIGIAMGGRGTDVAREAAAIVLLDDDFSAIAKAIRLGRRIYDNLRKAMGFIIAVHIPVAGLALIPLLTGLPVLLWPIHIAFLEMIIDPVCSLAFEAEEDEADIMNRPPRAPDAALLPPAMLVWSAIQGSVVLALVLGLYIGGSAFQLPADELRALAYFALVAGIMALIVVNRSFGASILAAIRRPNRTLAIIFTVITLVLCAALLLPPVAGLFGFGPLHLHDLAFVVGAGLVTLFALEAAKRLLPHPARAGRSVSATRG